MPDAIIEYVKNICPISPVLEAAIRERLEIMELPKKEVILKEGQRSDYIHVVLKGIIRMYYIRDGEEVSSRFVEELQIAASIISFYGREASYEFIETLEPVILARIHYDKLMELYAMFPEFNYIGRRITEQYFVRSEQRLYQLRKQSAEERYCFFVENYPSLYQRLPLKYIASYLGLTLETISRIRKKLSVKEQ